MINSSNLSAPKKRKRRQQRKLIEMKSESSTTSNDEDNSINRNERTNSKISVYCTMRSRSSSRKKYQQRQQQQLEKQQSSGTTTTTDSESIRSNSKNGRNDPSGFCTVSKRLRNFIKHSDDTTNLPYKKLQGSNYNVTPSGKTSVDGINFGLSNDLSTESIKNACDCYDLSDDDDDTGVDQLHCNSISSSSSNTTTAEAINNTLLDKIENHLSNFKRRSSLRLSTKSATFDRKNKHNNNNNNNKNSNSNHDHFHPYCTLRRDKISTLSSTHPKLMAAIATVAVTTTTTNSNKPYEKITEDLGLDLNSSVTSIATMNDHDHHLHQMEDSSTEAFNILSELDAILDNHASLTTTETSSLSSSSATRDEPEKIEDCLLELDAYLEEIDRLSLESHEDDVEGDGDDDHDYDNDGNNKSLQCCNSVISQQQQEQQLSNDVKVISNKNDRTKVGNRIQRSFTLPKKLRFRESHHDKTDHRSIAQAKQQQHTSSEDSFTDGHLRRGHKYRSTIAAASAVAVKPMMMMVRDDDRDPTANIKFFDTKEIKASAQHPKTWRRHSMRKTSLLVLPEQKNNSRKQFTQINSNSNVVQSPDTSQFIEPLNQSQNMEPIGLDAPRIVGIGLCPSSLPVTLNGMNEEQSTSLDHHQLQQQQQQYQQQPPEESDLRRCFSQNLNHLDIIHDIISHSSQEGTNITARPRQYGRRADCHPRVVSILAETSASGSQRIIVNHDRPRSAPAIPTATARSIVLTSPLATNECQQRYIGSEPSSVASSRNPSPVSLLSSTGSSSVVSTNPERSPESNSQHHQQQHQVNSSLDPDNIQVPRNQGNNFQWPHRFSRILALLCCTLGLFNISRFAILTISYGGNFLLQFLLLSIIFGIPMLWLQMCLGAKIKSGPVSMWKISPICKGIGISLLLTQCVIALYSTISLGWVLVYLRDSFISRSERYRWQEPFSIYRRSGNVTNNLTETVADYFNGIVLQRWQLGLGRRIETGGVRFQLAFNLAIIWAVVFIVLCKGLKSFGKIVLGLTLLPLILFIIVGCKLLYIIDFSSVQNIFQASDFEDFLVNSKTWIAAAQETFLTWNLLGPSVIAMSSKSSEKCEGKTVLRRDAILVVLLTLLGLSMAAIFGFACVQILENNKYLYFPGSYEYIDTYVFLFSLRTPNPPIHLSIPLKWTPHYSSVLGESYRRPQTIPFRESGYQALRLVTELFPATAAVATQEYISSVWSIVAFLMFLLFGLAQLCAMWKPISSALGNSTSSVLLSCVTGLLLGIPFATEMGLSIIHYLDIVVGGSWWILILWTSQILAVFLIRGRPYNGDVLVNDLHMSGSMSAFLALSWNVLLPIGLITLAIIEYKASQSNQFFHWKGKAYFSLWTRKVAGLIQVGFLLLVPITAFVQIYRYLTSGPRDILDRIQLLYRPTQTPPPHRRSLPSHNNRHTPSHITSVGAQLPNLESQSIQDDAPPKYTPPPSYTTATGARLAKMLRQSIRRSVRRFLGESSRTRPSIPTTSAQQINSTALDSSLPPEYSTVLSNPSGSDLIVDNLNCEIGPRPLYNSSTQRTQSMERRPNSSSSSTSMNPSIISDQRNNNNRNAAAFTAFDVAQILRSSSRHERSASTIATCVDSVLRTSSMRSKSSRSAENLVLNAAPLGESNAIVLRRDDDDAGDSSSINNGENTSVI